MRVFKAELISLLNWIQDELDHILATVKGELRFTATTPARMVGCPPLANNLMDNLLALTPHCPADCDRAPGSLLCLRGP
jgi:hypothetical protein